MDKIDELLTRGVDKIYPTREELEKILRSGKKLKLYQGFDPTGTQLHIGHAVALRKLRQFQDLGHEVIFLIGDFTAMIGDPTGKLDARKMLTKEDVLHNAKEYKEQAARILRFDGPNPVIIKYNSEWLGTISALEFLRLAHHLTYQQVVERDMFQERMKRGQDIYVNEFLYPVMQAYDSVAMDVDLEIGGTDQTFNMLMGRKLMRNMKGKEKFVMTVPLLTDAKGIKIGKTEGNVIGLTDAPNEFYAKIMSLGDDAIIPCFTLLTDESTKVIEETKKKMEAGENPMLFKKQLAFQLTKQFNSEQEAQEAQMNFERTFQQKELSRASIPTIPASIFSSPMDIVPLLLKLELAKTKSEAKRLLKAGAVEHIEHNNRKVISINHGVISVNPGDILKVGPKKFIKFI